MSVGGRGSSVEPSGELSPRIDTLNGKSAPHMPGPWIELMRTMPGPSLTVPALRHCPSASRQHAEDAKTDGADEIPTSSPRHGGDNAWALLTTLQRSRRVACRWSAPRDMVKKQRERETSKTWKPRADVACRCTCRTD